MEASLRAVPTNTAEYKANRKLQRLMKRYLQRKERQAQRQLQVYDHELLLVIIICFITNNSCKKSTNMTENFFLKAPRTLQCYPRNSNICNDTATVDDYLGRSYIKASINSG
jgi:hypothetical protein